MENQERKSIHIVALTLAILFFLMPILQYVITKQFFISNKFISLATWPFELAIIVTNKVGYLLGMGFEAMLLLVPFVLVNLILFSVLGWLLGLFIEGFVEDKNRKKLISRVSIGLFILYFVLLPVILYQNRIMDTDIIEVGSGYRIEFNEISADPSNDKLWIGFLVTKDYKSVKIKNVEMEIIKDDKTLEAKKTSPYFNVFNCVKPPFLVKVKGINLDNADNVSDKNIEVSKSIEIRDANYLDTIR